MGIELFEIRAIEDEDRGNWVAYVLDFPACASWGSTKAEALDNLKVIASAYIRAKRNGREPFTTDEEQKQIKIFRPSELAVRKQ